MVQVLQSTQLGLEHGITTHKYLARSHLQDDLVDGADCIYSHLPKASYTLCTAMHIIRSYVQTFNKFWYICISF